MLGWLVLLLGGSRPPTALPGGVVRRRGDLSRVVRRPGSPSRVVRRPAAMPAATFPTDARVRGPNEVVAYVFDFTAFQEAADGETIDAVSVPAVSGITVTAGAVLAAEADGVKAGKGFVVTVSGGTAGTDYTVAGFATFSGGAVREVRLLDQVR